MKALHYLINGFSVVFTTAAKKHFHGKTMHL